MVNGERDQNPFTVYRSLFTLFRDL